MIRCFITSVYTTATTLLLSGLLRYLLRELPPDASSSFVSKRPPTSTVFLCRDNFSRFGGNIRISVRTSSLTCNHVSEPIDSPRLVPDELNFSKRLTIMSIDGGYNPVDLKPFTMFCFLFCTCSMNALLAIWIAVAFEIVVADVYMVNLVISVVILLLNGRNTETLSG